MNNAVNENPALGTRRWIVPAVLIACITVVGFWEIMANRTRDPFRPFDLTAESFAGFLPAETGWSFQPIPVAASPAEPNILAFNARKHGGGSCIYRLVHGYNMHDCMRIKGYKVELIEDRRQRAEVGGQRAEVGGQGSEGRGQGAEVGTSEIGNRKSEISNSSVLAGRVQVWRLTSGSGDVSIWATSMLRAGDFSFLDMDVRSMPFPRVGVPDDPGWVPRGLTLASFHHPLRSLRLFFRSKWNGARCDVATFLRLKTPAWADDEILTAVSASECQISSPASAVDVICQVIEVQGIMQAQLVDWRLENLPVKP